MLRFQADVGVRVVELKPWLIRGNVHAYAAFFSHKAGCGAHAASLENVVFVVARIKLPHDAEIEARALHRKEPSRGYELAVHLRVLLGVYLQAVGLGAAASVQVEVGVVGEVDRGVLAAACAVAYGEASFFAELVEDAYAKLPGVALVAVRGA